VTPGAVLLVAKAPVAGLAKTRLAATIGADAAADIASAALLDTLEAATASGAGTLVAFTGDVARAARRSEVEAALSAATVFDQRGDGLGARLAAAHADAHELVGAPVLQVGMDTPQLTGALLADALDAARTHDAVLGPASDGGWWGLAVVDPALAAVLAEVPMSTDETGALTREALAGAGATVHLLPALRDVDTWADAVAVAALRPAGRFATAVARAGGPIRVTDGDESPR